MMALPMRRLMGAASARRECGGGRKRPLVEAVAVPPIRTVTASATPTVNTRRNFTSETSSVLLSGLPGGGPSIALPKRSERISGTFPENIDGNRGRQRALPGQVDNRGSNVRARRPRRGELAQVF